MTDTNGGRKTKVARVIDEYDLSGMGAELEAAWTGASGERTSLRDLADEFNERVLEEALRKAGLSPLDYEVTGTYETLRHGTGSDATRARRRLEREDIDVDSLTDDFVTHQAVHTYLTKEREATLPERTDNTVARKVETIEKLNSRVSAVTDSAITSLIPDEELERTDFEVLVDVRVVCSECGSDYSVGDLLRQGGCDCADESD